MDGVVSTNNCDLSSLGSEDKRLGANEDGRASARGTEIHLRIHSGKEDTVRVWNLNFHQHGTRGGIEGACRARHCTLEEPPWHACDRQGGCLALVNRSRVGLRNIHVSPQHAHLGNTEKQSVAGDDQRPRIHIANGNDSIEWRFYHAIIQDILQARDVCFRGGDVAALRRDGLFERLHSRRLCSELSLPLVVILFRDDALRGKSLPPICGNTRKLEVGFALLVVRQGLLQRSLGGLQGGLSLTELLIQLGGFNFG